MDQVTYDLRLANWKAVIERCQARPAGQTARQWLTDNRIPEKQYYYWLRRVRKSLLARESPTDSIDGKRLPAAPYVEIPAREVFADRDSPAVTIKTKKSTIEISASVPAALMVELVKAVSHAL